jgi:aspartate aminotransferase-like enzyme
MSRLVPEVDPEGLFEYSVSFTDRATNHMSAQFQGAMRDISGVLKRAYNAQSAIVVPGSGTFGMEAVARQFASGRKCLVIRNGWFSYRWTQILEAGRIPAEANVLKARRLGADWHAPYVPPPIEEVVRTIRETRPDVVFAPHVETASGMMLTDDYLSAMANAVRSIGGLLVLDCIASGAIWVDMAASGVDVLVSAPQKGWSGSPCCAFVMLGERARAAIESTVSTSFVVDLRAWMNTMEAYEQGTHGYHCTMPTDALTRCRDAMVETERSGFENLRTAQWTLGHRVRALLDAKGHKAVTAQRFQSPGVIVSYNEDPEIFGKFAAAGLQIALCMPLACDEPADFSTFRIGLFGLEKLRNVDRTVQLLESALGELST